MNGTTDTTPPLTLSVSLHFDWGSSNKFYDLILVGRHVLIRFGRTYLTGETLCKEFPTEQAAAAEAWKLLRSKTGKGYHVEWAFTRTVAETLRDPNMFDWVTLDEAWHTMEMFFRLPARRGRCSGPDEPEFVELSPRTPRQGAQVLLELTDPDAGEEFLLASALAGDDERFLHLLVATHPNCPDTARVVEALRTPLHA